MGFLVSFLSLGLQCFLGSPLREVGNEGFCQETSDLVDCEKESEVTSQFVYSQEVEAHVQQVEEIVTEHEGESFYDQGVVEVSLGSVILVFCGGHCNFLESPS